MFCCGQRRFATANEKVDDQAMENTCLRHDGILTVSLNQRESQCRTDYSYYVVTVIRSSQL